MTRICIISNTGEDLRRATPWLREDGIDVDLMYGAELTSRPDAVKVTDYDGFIFPGGAGRAYQTDVYPWLTQVYAIAKEAVAANIPVLGICLGAQMLTYVLDGTVEHLPFPRVTGMTPITAQAEAMTDELMHVLPESYPMIENHEDFITQLPQGAVPLATSQGCPIEAFRYGERCWGIQFHPETGVDYIKESWAHNPDFIQGLQEAGLDISTIVDGAETGNTCNTQSARAFFRQFAQICHHYAQSA